MVKVIKELNKVVKMVTCTQAVAREGWLAVHVSWRGPRWFQYDYDFLEDNYDDWEGGKASLQKLFGTFPKNSVILETKGFPYGDSEPHGEDRDPDHDHNGGGDEKLPDGLWGEALEAGVGHQVKLAGVCRQDAGQKLYFKASKIVFLKSIPK